MVKFLIGVGTGVFVVFLSIVLLFMFLLHFREKPPVLANNSVLVVKLEGEIPEKPPVELPPLLGDRPGVTVANVWMSLRKAAVDPHIRAVVLQPEGVHAGWAKLEEIRAGLERFKKSGKPLYAYLRAPGTREYYLASVADRIYLGPADPLYLKGMRAETMYFRKTLDKIGVSVEVEHAGKYKDFGDMFTRSDMSPATKEVLNGLLDEIYGNLVTGIAEGRKKTPAQVRALIDQGPFLAKEAQAAGLVDGLRFEDEMWGELAAKLGGGSPQKVSLGKYVKVPAGDLGLTNDKNLIAMVVGQGEITRGSESDDGAGESGITAYGFNKLLKRVAGDSAIKGVIVRIDSPGGEVTASDEIWREMNLLSKKKPLVISMSDSAASGGYYMAMTGDPIVAYPGTVTGSIGVVFGKPNLHGLYDKLGITKDSLKRGRFADIDSDYKPLDTAERAKLRAGIDDTYRDFVTKVAAARHRKFDEVEPLSQGRVWLGSQARTRGLVDELGGIDRAIELLKQKARIPAAEKVTLLTYPARRNLMEMLLHRTQREDMVTAKVAEALPGVPVRAWLKGGFLRLVPYAVDVR
jgi:protease IV